MGSRETQGPESASAMAAPKRWVKKKMTKTISLKYARNSAMLAWLTWQGSKSNTV
ncbi:hypothetical protein [Fulmarus glacialis papillomavirus 1]|uniref:Uncharacterized protein n=1 Tax=Fulmarus glacialis papillomavirus 1 TaxID=1463817 RepID=A0A059TAV3_9PAPI|nr:hypothetical protein [Fulmarus glacialis papillomavirus 1]AHV82122.1 hypothetical protein [Fulmarus glacialis papillomavirus 1]